jgi:hypothetical protein
MNNYNKEINRDGLNMKKHDNYDNSYQKVSIYAYIVIFAIILDVMLSMSIDVLEKQLVSIWGITLFVAIILSVYIPAQYLLSGFVNKVSKEIRLKNSYFRIMYNAVLLSQYVIGVIMLITIFQIVVVGKYSIDLLIAATAISYTLATIIMIMFSYRFFAWYRSSIYEKKMKRKNYTTLLLLLFYGIAGSMASISIGSHDIAFNNIMLKELFTSSSPSSSSMVKVQQVLPQSDIKFTEISTNTLGVISGSLYIVGLLTLIPAFILAWAGSAVLLNNYSQNVGRLKFWIVISLPLLFYIITIIPTVLTPSGKLSFYEEKFISFRLINKLTVIVSSIIFGVAFLAIGRNIQQHNAMNQNVNSNSVKYYMFISAYGVLTFANLVATPIHHTTWPPFGFAASSFISMASFLLSLGFYSSAVSVSQDLKLRRLIRHYIEDHRQQMNFLDSIGTAQGEHEIQKKVLEILKENSDLMEQESGVQTSITENEIKDYLQIVINETKNRNELTRDKDL